MCFVVTSISQDDLKTSYQQGSLPMHHMGNCFISAWELRMPQVKNIPSLVEAQMLKELLRLHFNRKSDF